MRGEAIQLLLVPSARGAAREDALLREGLARGRAAAERGLVRLERADALDSGLERLRRGGVDAVLLDLGGAGARGAETVLRLRACDAEVPLVVLTERAEAAATPGLLRAGAQDCVVKDGSECAARVHLALRHAIERQRIAREERALGRRLARSERMASLGLLCAGMGFGLSRLVGTILEQTDAAAELLPQAGPQPKARRELRRRLLATRKAALRAGALAGQLRDYAGEQRAAPHALDLSAFVLDSSASLDAVAGGIPLDYDVPSGGPIVVAGRLPLYQVLVGLVRNAAEALEPGRGHIAVATGLQKADAELLGESLGAAQLVPGIYAFLRVSDDGRGIAPEAAERIFDPFYSTKCAGRGLGLSAVLGIVRALQGRIHVCTDRGRGSTFTVLLPLGQEGGAESRPPRSEP